MEIVYAAEKQSITSLLSEHIGHQVAPNEIDIRENPDETGSFRIGWHFRQFLMSPSGEIISDQDV